MDKRITVIILTATMVTLGFVFQGVVNETEQIRNRVYIDAKFKLACDNALYTEDGNVDMNKLVMSLDEIKAEANNLGVDVEVQLDTKASEVHCLINGRDKVKKYSSTDVHIGK